VSAEEVVGDADEMVAHAFPGRVRVAVVKCLDDGGVVVVVAGAATTSVTGPKSLDTHCPMGPYAVTADEIADTAVEVRTHVNGELRQSASVKDMIFDVPELTPPSRPGSPCCPVT
jgi:hypothetical protein